MMNNNKCVIFDLDGTLTDPSLGITNSIAYALKKNNIQPPEREKLYKYIVSHAWTSVAQMCIAVNCRSADIKSHVSLIDRLENLFLSRKGIGYI